MILVIGTHKKVAVDPILQTSAGSHIEQYIMLIRFRSGRVEIIKVVPSQPHFDLAVWIDVMEVAPCVNDSASNVYLAKIGF